MAAAGSQLPSVHESSTPRHFRVIVVLGVLALALALFVLHIEPVLSLVLAALAGTHILYARKLQQLDASLLYRARALVWMNNAREDAAARSDEFADHLARINDAVQRALQGEDKGSALQRACQAAMTVGGADGAALFQPQNASSMVASSGLTDEQQRAYSQTPSPNLDPGGMHYLHDANAGDDEISLVDFAQVGGFRSLLYIPMHSTGTLFGHLTLFYAQPRSLSQSQLDLLEMLASQLAVVFDNVELFQSLENHAVEMAQLAHLARISASTLDLPQVAQDVARILCQVMNVSRTTVGLIEDNLQTLHTVGTATTDGTSSGLPNTMAISDLPELAAMLRQSPYLPRSFDSGDSALSPMLSHLMQQHDETTVALVPMTVNRTMVGFIMLGSREQREFSEREWQLVEMATSQIATHLQNARLYTRTQEALRQRLEELALLEDIARQISSTLDFNQIIRNILDAASRSTQANYTALALLNEGDTERRFTLDYLVGNGFHRAHSRLAAHVGGVIETVFTSGQAVRLADILDGEQTGTTLSGGVYRSSLAVPLLREEMVIGVLNVQSIRPAFFTDEHARFLRNLADHAVISIGNARMLEERQYQVSVLTHLQALALGLSSATDTHSVASAILHTTVTLFHADEAAIFSYDDRSSDLNLLAAVSRDGTPDATRIPALIAFEAARTDEFQIVQNSSSHASLVSLPLKHGNRVRHVLCIAFSQRRAFPKRDLDALSLLAGQATGHLENATLHEQMNTILLYARDGIILMDSRGRLVEANPAARHFLGEKFEEYIQSTAAQVIQWCDEINQHPEMTESQGTSHTFERHSERGVLFHLAAFGTPVLDTRQKAVGWLIVLRDITEEKLLAAYRDEISQMVVHDLRGPLASIISGLSLVSEELQSPVSGSVDDMQKLLSLSAESAYRLMTLVESLLDIDRLETRQMPLQREGVFVGGLVEDSIQTLAATLQQSGNELRRDIASDLPQVHVDAEMVRRVMINLLDNALRHTPARQPIAICAHLLVDDENFVIIRFADSGSGIPLEERTRVFEKFKQVKTQHPTTQRRGAGIGLTFCKLAVEAHGGRIWVEDQSPLGGASIAFTLPVAQSLSQHIPPIIES